MCSRSPQVLEMIDKKLGDKKHRSDMPKVEQRLDEICEDKMLTETQKKVCYFMQPIKREVSQLMKNGLPNDRICKRLGQKSKEICSVRNKVKVEKGATDYNALKVKDLKKILADRGVMCDGCVEKSDFVKKCVATESLEREL